ncbi:MAG: saccharopine dehydrogenase C-terminal domain-containing protein [Planctomycetota bacterium]
MARTAPRRARGKVHDEREQGMGYRYAVLGAGLQGTAAAYDMARFGDAEEIVLLDRSDEIARDAAARINGLLGWDVARGEALDVRDGGAVETALRGIDCTLSAVPYFFNPSIALACIHAGSHMCDLGGNTDVSRRVLKMNDEATDAGVSIIPDCGLAPGMANTLAVYGMSYMDEVESVQIRCGGLPQAPKPPLLYKVVFNIAGLTNEYFGVANFLRGGKVVQVETFTELEEIEFDAPVGRCEAFVTSGGTSTCPWTFEGKVENYDYKTVRYKGHYESFKVIRDLGLLDLEPIEVGGSKVVPRELFHRVASPRLQFPEDRDLVVLRVTVKGRRDGHDLKMVLEIMDFEDPETGFSAMQRTTGWAASVVAIMMAEGEVRPGATPLEQAVDGREFVNRFKRRGIRFTESMQRTLTDLG